MGLLRNIAKAALLFLFSLFLSLLLLTFFLYDLTNYENAKNLFTILFKEAMKNESQKIEEAHQNILNYCKLNLNASVELPENISLKCSEILNTSSSYLLSLIAEKTFDRLYYKTYECEMLECIRKIKSEEDLAIILSLKANEFFGKILQLLSILTIVFGVLLFISIETWPNRLKTFGFEFFSIGIFYFFIPYFKKLVLENFLKSVSTGENILDLIFHKLESILLIFFLIGLALIFGWIFLKFFGKKSK